MIDNYRTFLFQSYYGILNDFFMDRLTATSGFACKSKAISFLSQEKFEYLPPSQCTIYTQETLKQKVDAQLEVLGVSLAAHPLELVSDKLIGTGAISTLDAAAKIGHRITVAGVQQACHRSRTAGGGMLFLSFEDL